ncbi:MAG: hypothetical protein Q8O38_16720 [Sulfurimicrobium sp.]|nr:hypothetical protein [Sulfurimicrobium sp.]
MILGNGIIKTEKGVERLANALSALYLIGSEEKRLLGAASFLPINIKGFRGNICDFKES